MELSILLFLLGVFIAGMWFIFRFERIKHKVVITFLIALILFSFISFNAVFNGKVSINSFSDVETIGKTYLSWLVNVFNNLKMITSNAIKMDWQTNNTST